MHRVDSIPLSVTTVSQKDGITIQSTTIQRTLVDMVVLYRRQALHIFYD